jgi:hypothetical protein
MKSRKTKEMILGSDKTEELAALRDRLKEVGLEYNEHFHLWELPYASFSDYSGSMVERANAEEWKKRLGNLVSVGHGGHGTEITGLHDEDDEDTVLGDITHEHMETIVSTIEDLENYPVLDEERLSELEQEEADRSWNEFTRDDFRKDMQKAAKKDNAGWDAWLPFSLTDADMDELRYRLENASKMEVVIETGGSAYFHLPKYDDVDLDWLDTPERRAQYEAAKRLAWDQGLNDVVYDALRQFPEAEQSSQKASENRVFQVLDEFLEEQGGWWSPDDAEPGEPMNYDADQVKRWVEELRPHSLQPPEDPRQQRLGL